LNDFLFVVTKCFLFFVIEKNTFLKNQKIDFSEKLKNEVFEIFDQNYCSLS